MGNLYRTHPLDRLIQDDSLFFLEAMIPFVDLNTKKVLVVLLKYREISAIMNSLGNPELLQRCGFDCHPKSKEDFISDIFDFMPKEYKNNVNQMQQMMSMMNTMQMMNQMEQGTAQNNSSSSNSESLYDSIVSILDNESMEY